MNIICFGDSITAARPFAEADRWPNILQGLFDAWRPGEYKVFNRGIGGNTSAQGFSRFQAEIMPLLPGLLLVEYGFNDASVPGWSRDHGVGVEEFKANLREFARAARAGGGRCVFIVNHTHQRPHDFGARQGNGRPYGANFKPYNPAIRQVAKAARCPAIDLPAIMKKRKVNLEEFLNPDDKLHLTPSGNHVYAAMVFDALREILKRLRG